MKQCTTPHLDFPEQLVVIQDWTNHLISCLGSSQGGLTLARWLDPCMFLLCGFLARWLDPCMFVGGFSYGVSEWVWVSEWVSQSVWCEGVSEWVSLSERVSEWLIWCVMWVILSERVSESVGEWVCEQAHDKHPCMIMYDPFSAQTYNLQGG